MTESHSAPSGSAAELVLAAIDREETLELLQELIRRPSENPPGDEEATVAVLASFFGQHGIPFLRDEVRPGRPNLIAELGAGERPTLVFNGHTDTVPFGDGWTYDPVGAHFENGRVYGRGACDMLAGVAAMSEAAVALHRSGVPIAGRLLVHAVIDEEVDAIGSQRAASDLEADWVIVTEATGDKIGAFGKGQINLEITFRGKAAHSSTPELGRNAINDAAAFVALLEREAARLADSPYPGVGPVTFTPAIVHGGSHGSTVPAECQLVLDRRLLPTETLEQAQRHIDDLLAQLAQERPGLDASLEPTLLFPPLPPTEDDALAAAIQQATAELGGAVPEVSGFRGATDAAWYAANGISAVIYGPGDGQTAHQPDEFIEVDDLHFTTRVLALAALRLVGAA
jgi:acetylornithine deacetylase/succinyl-diaminopimelate desuccinylase family protein